MKRIDELAIIISWQRIDVVMRASNINEHDKSPWEDEGINALLDSINQLKEFIAEWNIESVKPKP